MRGGDSLTGERGRAERARLGRGTWWYASMNGRSAQGGSPMCPDLCPAWLREGEWLVWYLLGGQRTGWDSTRRAERPKGYRAQRGEPTNRDRRVPANDSDVAKRTGWDSNPRNG